MANQHTSVEQSISTPHLGILNVAAQNLSSFIPSFDCKVLQSHKHFSDSFSDYAPTLWNSLPFHMRNSSSVTCLGNILRLTFLTQGFLLSTPPAAHTHSLGLLTRLSLDYPFK